MISTRPAQKDAFHLQTEFSDSAQKNGGTAETGRQGKTDMLNVLATEDDSKVLATKFNTTSDHRKMAIWLDKLVTEAVAKGKPATSFTKLTPTLAQVLLDRNPDNRKLSVNTVERFAYDLAGGHWSFNGESIIVSDTGHLNDGQHRCLAVVQSGVSMDVVLIVGVPRESRTTLDQGRARTAADYLSMEGHINTNVLAAAANMAWQYNNRGMLASGSATKAAKQEVLRFVADNPGLRRSVGIFTQKAAKGLGGLSVLAFCHFAISGEGKREDVVNFFLALTEGVNLGKGHPALYVRNRMLSLIGKRDLNARAELIFKAWNAWRTGQPIDRIWLSGGVLPVLEK